MSGKIIITVKSAQLTRDTEFIGSMDPYVEFKSENCNFKTEIAKGEGKELFGIKNLK